MNVMTHERFWEKVNVRKKDECWLWQRFRDKGGYGRVGFEGKSQNAHRVAYVLTFGDFDRSLDVCHKCDTPSCCNPHHLFLGTAKVNVNDAIQKGRWPSMKGEKSPRHILVESDVRAIRNKWKPVYGSAAALAREFKVSEGCIWGIITERHWKGV